MEKTLGQYFRIRNYWAAGTLVIAAVQCVLIFPFFAQTLHEMPKPWDLGPGGLPAGGAFKKMDYSDATLNKLFGSMLLSPLFMLYFLLTFLSWNKTRSRRIHLESSKKS